MSCERGEDVAPIKRRGMLDAEVECTGGMQKPAGEYTTNQHLHVRTKTIETMLHNTSVHEHGTIK